MEESGGEVATAQTLLAGSEETLIHAPTEGTLSYVPIVDKEARVITICELKIFGSRRKYHAPPRRTAPP